MIAPNWPFCKSILCALHYFVLHQWILLPNANDCNVYSHHNVISTLVVVNGRLVLIVLDVVVVIVVVG